jgi:hypothetical protein
VSRQEFSWTEDGLDAAKAERGSNLSREGLANIDREPMFCFEVESAPCSHEHETWSAQESCGFKGELNMGWQRAHEPHVGRLR